MFDGVPPSCILGPEFTATCPIVGIVTLMLVGPDTLKVAPAAADDWFPPARFIVKVTMTSRTFIARSIAARSMSPCLRCSLTLAAWKADRSAAKSTGRIMCYQQDTRTRRTRQSPRCHCHSPTCGSDCSFLIATCVARFVRRGIGVVMKLHGWTAPKFSRFFLALVIVGLVNTASASQNPTSDPSAITLAARTMTASQAAACHTA